MASFVSCKRNIFSFLRRELKSPEVLPRSFEPVLFPAEKNRKTPRFCLGALNLFFFLRREQKLPRFYLGSFESCGENRIRTCEPVLPVTRFPGVPLQPLEHLSFSLRMQRYELNLNLKNFFHIFIRLPAYFLFADTVSFS